MNLNTVTLRSQYNFIFYTRGRKGAKMGRGVTLSVRVTYGG